MKLPLSILLPNYNHAYLLGGAIESVLSQSFSDFELIVIDDGSTDHSLDVIQMYLKKDSRITLIQHATNQGIATGIKSGLERARGHYIHGLSATDAYLPEFLKRSMRQLQQFPEIGLCCTDAGLFNDDPQSFVPTKLLENAPSALVFPAAKIPNVFKYAHFSIPGLTAIMKRSLFQHCGGYREKLLFLCDTILNQQVALLAGAIYIPETLVVFRKPFYSKVSSCDPQIRNKALCHLREMLLLPEQRAVLKSMSKAAVLGMLCKEQPLACLKHPVLWACYPRLIHRYLRKHFRRALGKPLVSEAFLNRYIVD